MLALLGTKPRAEKTLAPAFHPPLKLLVNSRAVVKELTDKRLRRGAFTNVGELIEAITTWGSHWQGDPKPFSWHTPADKIIDKVRRGRTALKARTVHIRCISPPVRPSAHPGLNNR